VPRSDKERQRLDRLGEGSSSANKKEGVRRVSIQGAERRRRAGSRRAVPGLRTRGLGERVHRDRIGRSGRERIAAPTLPGPSSANCTGSRRAPTPYDVARDETERRKAADRLVPRSPCSLKQG
jgi:hypothetical protein